MVSPPPGAIAVVSLTKPTVTQFTLGSSQTVSFGAAAEPRARPNTLSATVNGAAVDASQMTSTRRPES